MNVQRIIMHLVKSQELTLLFQLCLPMEVVKSDFKLHVVRTNLNK